MDCLSCRILGWAQWYNGEPLDYQSAQEVFPDLADLVPSGFEFFMANDSYGDNTFESWSFSKRVMNSQTGLNNMLIYQGLLAYLNSQPDDSKLNFTAWGITKDQAENFQAYALTIAGGITIPAIMANSGPTGGLIATRSVRQWVFDCTDYLITILQPSAPPCSILVNHTSLPPTTIWTGKSDINKINQYVKWMDVSEIPGIWKSNLTVSGYTELGQFKPYLRKDESLYVFDTDLIRTVRMDPIGSTTIKGINAYSYIMNSSTFDVSNFFYQSFPGVANVSSVENGSPMFLGYFDLLHVDPSKKNIDGLNNSATDFDSIATLDVEPTTGITIQAHQRLQINVYIPPEAKSWFTFSPYGNDKFVINTLYPIAKAGEYVTLSDDEAKILKNKLKLVPEYTNALFYVYVTVGPALLVAGIVLTVFGLKRRSMVGVGYMNIN